VLTELQGLHVRYVIAHIGDNPATTGYPAAALASLRGHLPVGARLERVGDSFLLELPAP
jgi:hypothetical protein